MSYFERLRTKKLTKADTTLLVDESGFEILAAWHMEEGGICLDSCEVVIAGIGIDLLPTLKKNQYDAICETIQNSFR